MQEKLPAAGSMYVKISAGNCQRQQGIFCISVGEEKG